MFLGFYLIVTLNGGMDRLFAAQNVEQTRPNSESRSALDGGADGSMPGDGSLVKVSGASSGETMFHGIHVRPIPPIKVGEPFYFRCWDADSETPFEGESCGRIKRFERAIAARLGHVLRCYERLDRQKTTGHLSLAVDVSFAGVERDGEGEFRLWSGGSTTVENEEAFLSCIRQRFDPPSLSRIRHQKERYTIFFPIDFLAESEEGRQVEVVLDRVRLRREPVKGSIRAVLSQGEPITIYEVRDSWVRGKTMDGREGWLFAEGITVPEP